MGLVKQVQVRPLRSLKGQGMEFYTPQSSHETLMVSIPIGTIDELFVHRFQTDQIVVVRGSFVLVTLQNRCYQYIGLSASMPSVVTIPPGVLHGAINLGSEPCVIVNAVLRHGDAHPRDYQPIKPPFPYDLKASVRAMTLLDRPVAA
jgi:hypothetical protein